MLSEDMRSSSPSVKAGWELFKKMNSPKFVMAPMVDASELPFRMLGRKYGADLCYTPMMHSAKFTESVKYRKENFTTCKEDRPLIAQFCGNDPDTIIEAAKYVQHECDAIDLNLGCPQKIASRGFYGAFLLEDCDRVIDIVSKMSSALDIPVTCKIRLFDDFDRTLDLCKRLQDAGCALLTVHGRTKEMRREKMINVDFDAIRRIKEELDIPVFTNGGVEVYEDLQKCLDLTKCDGIMVSEAILSNPAIFMPPNDASGKLINRIALANEYLDLVEMYPAPLGMTRGHVLKMLYPFLWVHTELRQKIAIADSFKKIRQYVSQLEEVIKDSPIESKYTYPALSWYRRRWHMHHPDMPDPRTLVESMHSEKMIEDEDTCMDIMFQQ